MMVSPFEIHPTTFTSMMLGVTLRPTGAATLFDLPLHEVTDTALSLDQLIGTEAQRLIDQLHEAASDSDRVHLLTRWIITRLAQRPKANNIVELAVSEIERSRGTLRIASLLKTLGVSAKRLTQLFQHHVGVSPKTFSRIVRFRSAIEYLYSTDITLAQLATTYGYYDQAHMNADFREYAGISPGQFFATKRFPGSHTLAV